MNLVLIQPGDEASLQAITLARSLGGPVHALLIGSDEGASELAVDVVHVARHDGLTGFAPDAWARITTDTADRIGATAIVAAGTERGNDVMARVAARTGQPLAANCTSVDARRSHRADPHPLGRQPVRGGPPALRTGAADGSRRTPWRPIPPAPPARLRTSQPTSMTPISW